MLRCMCLDLCSLWVFGCVHVCVSIRSVFGLGCVTGYQVIRVIRIFAKTYPFE